MGSRWGFRELQETPPVRNLLVGMPDVGLVGLIASTYLVRETRAEVTGLVDSRYLPPVVIYHEARPIPPARFHILKNGAGEATLILVSEVAMEAAGIHSFAREFTRWALAKGVERIVMLGGIPSPQRFKTEQPKIYGAGVKDEDLEMLRGAGIEVFREGFISGPYAALIKEISMTPLKGVALLAEAFLNYPDPGAAAALLGVLGPLINVQVDVKPLLEQAEEIRLKLRESMKRTLEAMRQSGKEYEYTVPAMYI